MPLEAPVMRIVLPERRFETAVDMVRWVVLKWEALGGLKRVLGCVVLERVGRKECGSRVDLVVSRWVRRWDGRVMVGSRARRGGMGRLFRKREN